MKVFNEKFENCIMEIAEEYKYSFLNFLDF